MALLTVQLTNRTAGLDLSTAVAADVALADRWVNTGAEVFYIKNGGAGSINITEVLAPGATTDGIAPASRVVAIAAGATKILGPFAPGIYNDVNSQMNIQYSAVTSVTVMAFKVGP